MTPKSSHLLQVANLVLSAFLLFALIGNLAMNDKHTPAFAEQSIKTPLSAGGHVLTARREGESLREWSDRHAAALKEFSQ